MISANQLIDAYIVIADEVRHYPGSERRFVVIDDIRKRLRVRVKTLVRAIESFEGCRLAKAPAAFRERRYMIRGEEWSFIAIPREATHK